MGLRERMTRRMIKASSRRKATEPPTAPAIRAVLSAEAGGVDVTGDAEERAVLLGELDVTVMGDVDAEERARLLVELDNTIVLVEGSVDIETVVVLVGVKGTVFVLVLVVVIGQLAGGRDEQEQLAAVEQS